MDFVRMDRLLFCIAWTLWLAKGILVQSVVKEISQGPNWIATGFFNPERISPLCSHVCFNALGFPDLDLFNRTVGLYECNFRSDPWNDHWIYNSSSEAITISEWRANKPSATYCLDNLNITTPFASDFTDDESNKFYFHVTTCTSEISQQWFPEDDGKIRSALRSQNGEALYIQANLRSDNSWAMAGLFLSPAGAKDVHLYFTFIPVPTDGIPLAAKFASIPSPGEGSNLVSNGGFEVTSPRNTSTRTFTIQRGEPDLCYWTVGDMNVQSPKICVVNGNEWYPSEGSNSLLLGAEDLSGDATLTQLTRTRPQENYTLSFSMAANSPCVKRVTTIRVELSPSNNSLGLVVNQTYSFNSEGKSPINMGWVVKSLDFAATTEVTNLTFISSMNAGKCACVIDNVTVVKLERFQQPVYGDDQNSKPISVAAIIGIAIAASLTFLGIVFLAVWLLTRIMNI